MKKGLQFKIPEEVKDDARLRMLQSRLDIIFESFQEVRDSLIATTGAKESIQEFKDELVF